MPCGVISAVIDSTRDDTGGKGKSSAQVGGHASLSREGDAPTTVLEEKGPAGRGDSPCGGAEEHGQYSM